MLAIGRALLLEPSLLVMDEPTEGLAPMIVEQVVEALRGLAAESEIAVLLIEQNLGVAIDVADRIGVMVNGRIAHEMPAAELAADRELQERLLGVRSGANDDEADAAPAPTQEPAPTQVFTVRRAHGDGAPSLDDLAPGTVRGFNRWNAGGTAGPMADIARAAPSFERIDPAQRRVGASRRRRRARRAGLRLPRRRQQRARRLRRRHLRHQGARALLPAPVPREARPARRHGRPRDLRQAVDGERASARGRAPPSRRRSSGVHLGPRQRGQRDGGRVRALRPHAPRPGRHHLGRRLGRHDAGDAGDARACRSACPR